MVRAAAAVLLFAVIALVATSVTWLRASGPSGAPIDGRTDPDALLTSFERGDTSAISVDLSARYQGRLDLLEPRNALPLWHKHARARAVRVYEATRSCPPPPIDGLGDDPDLAKAWSWHARTCAPGSAAPDELVDRAPFIHPSGKSYAALAIVSGGGVASAASYAKAHVRSLHVLELAALDPTLLDREDRALASIPASGWQALARGDRILLLPRLLVVAERGQLGLSTLRFHSRAAWDDLARATSVAIAPRKVGEACARPATPDLCWRSLTPMERHREGILAAIVGSGGLALLASVALAIAYVGERRRVHADRIHVLRTLTHELRTPATSLRLDIEPLRAAYDQLPESCQEPLLRISEDIERLHRVLHRSARYMALFESTASPKESLVKAAPVSSVKEMLEDFAEEWPEGVVIEAGGPDGAVRTDTDWLSVAARNLVENASRHGRPPVTVTWKIEGDDLVLRVADGGETPKLSLRRAIAQHERDDDSPGLGLGLAIVDRIARLLGGRLLHEPSPTVFELRVPANAKITNQEHAA